jgi:hypothetical protein
VRITYPSAKYIGFKLNLLGIRVSSDDCQLLAKDGNGRWSPLGPPRPLPIDLPTDPSKIGPDALILTALQYDSERPGSDLRALLAKKKDFEAALNEQ